MHTRNPPKHLIKHLARQNRWQPTRSEARLWEALRRGQLGVRFCRQVAIGRYIADFASREARVVEEVDGGCHAGREKWDSRRDAWLRGEGWRVVHVTAEAVMRDVAGVVAAVREALHRP